MSYKKLKIWSIAREVAIEVYEMSLNLPKFEMYEEGSQIRRSSKSTKALIVEGYGRRIFKQDWLKYLYYAISSNDETLDHLENLWETKSLSNETQFMNLNAKIQSLGKMLNNFLQAVQKDHLSAK